MKQFLGLVGYYRRFISDFAKISKPLTQLLEKDISFLWGPEQQKAFEILRDKLCSEPLLQYPDFNKPSVVTTDASDFALGAVLSQGQIGRDLPIAYASRTLDKAETNYSTTEKELLAIVFAVKHFRPYLYGHKFTLVTDHRPLLWLNGLKDPVSRLARWKIKLTEFDYDIVYKRGIANSNADALSRNPPDLSDLNGPIIEPIRTEKIASVDAPKSAQSVLRLKMGNRGTTEEEDRNDNYRNEKSERIDEMIVKTFLTFGELENHNETVSLGNGLRNEDRQKGSACKGKIETPAGYRRPQILNKALSCQGSTLGTPLSPMLGVTLVPWAEGMRHRNSDENVDITGAWSRNGEVSSPRGEVLIPKRVNLVR